MTSGREVAESALAPVLTAVGWKARAAGWFTKEVGPGATGVLAVSVASKHHAAGSASVTLIVGLRDEATEEVVEQVSGPSSPRYAGRTWITPLGHLLPSGDYRAGERDFDEQNAAEKAEELAQLLATDAEPRLRQVADDLLELRALAEASTSGMGPAGLCRIATLVAKTHGPDAASEYVAQRLTSLGGRTDPAADLERDVGPRVIAALTPM